MTDRQSTHGHDCLSWGPKHYECAVREIKALRAEVDAQQAEIDQLREQLRLALRDAAPAVQGEPVAYISQEDFEFLLSDDMSEQYGTRQALVFSRKDYRVSVPLYASPQPPAQDPDTIRALLEELDALRAERDDRRLARSRKSLARGVSGRRGR